MAKIKIRPTSGVYATYKRLSYQPWTAIAEFVDNSTQSYFDHKAKLKAIKDFDKLNIVINYEQSPDGNDVLSIIDNAFGMEWDDFERAIVLGEAPPNTNGRNEFGMGLKTAACWFGRKWSVESTQLGSFCGYSATVDVDKLGRDKDEEIEAAIFDVPASEHYTVIRIENLNKKLTASRTIWKIKELLSSIYRQDLRDEEVTISYNGTELVYKDPDIFEEEQEDGTVEKWRKEIDFSINHDGKELFVKGFIAIRIPASLKDAGFTLLRRGRVIVGGPEKNYRPNELFGDPNSYAYQRLFGELNMDNWPVTQAKDDFDWHSDGLEEKFIEKLAEYSKPFRTKAEQIRVRQKVETDDVMKKVVDDFQKAGLIQNVVTKPLNEEQDEKNNVVKQPEKVPVVIPQPDDQQAANNSIETGLIIKGASTFETTFEYKGTQYVFIVEFETSNPFTPWVTLSSSGDGAYTIRINMRHPFFKPFIDNKEFTVVLTKLVIAMVLAEAEAIKISHEGLIESGTIRNKMNNILQDLSMRDIWG